jgi:hypothetical protein
MRESPQFSKEELRGSARSSARRSGWWAAYSPGSAGALLDAVHGESHRCAPCGRHPSRSRLVIGGLKVHGVRTPGDSPISGVHPFKRACGVIFGNLTRHLRPLSPEDSRRAAKGTGRSADSGLWGGRRYFGSAAPTRAERNLHVEPLEPAVPDPAREYLTRPQRGMNESLHDGVLQDPPHGQHPCP